MNLSITSLSQWQKTALSLALAALVGYAFGRYAQPAKIQIQTQTVVKEVETVKHDTVTTTKEIKEPNGAIETDTTVVDKDVDSTQIQSNTKTSETITNVKPQWFATVGMGMGSGSLTDGFTPIYNASVNRRILGPIYLGVWGNEQSFSKVQGGVQIGLEF